MNYHKANMVRRLDWKDMREEKDEKELITETINGFLNTVNNDLGIKKYGLPVKHDIWSKHVGDALTVTEEEWDLF